MGLYHVLEFICLLACILVSSVEVNGYIAQIYMLLKQYCKASSFMRTDDFILHLFLPSFLPSFRIICTLVGWFIGDI